MTETAEVIGPWLYGRLSGDAELVGLVAHRIYPRRAPSGAATPFVIYALQSPRDVMGAGTTRIMVDDLYVVKATVKSESNEKLVPIARRLEALLQGASGQVTAGHVLGVVREMPIDYGETVDGGDWSHLGGLWRIWAHSGP